MLYFKTRALKSHARDYNMHILKEERSSHPSSHAPSPQKQVTVK